MNEQRVVDFARGLVSAFGVRQDWFSEKALWAAGESQKITAIPALTLVASVSLLVVVLWIMLVAWTVSLIRRVWRDFRGNHAETR